MLALGIRWGAFSIHLTSNSPVASYKQTLTIPLWSSIDFLHTSCTDLDHVAKSTICTRPRSDNFKGFKVGII